MVEETGKERKWKEREGKGEDEVEERQGENGIEEELERIGEG
jgi:hypothetical protein